jgi:hypothetical protein
VYLLFQAENETKNVHDALGNERKNSAALRAKALLLEKQVHALEQNLRSKDTQLAQINAKHQNVSTRLQQEQQARKDEVDTPLPRPRAYCCVLTWILNRKSN